MPFCCQTSCKPGTLGHMSANREAQNRNMYECHLSGCNGYVVMVKHPFGRREKKSARNSFRNHLKRHHRGTTIMQHDTLVDSANKNLLQGAEVELVISERDVLARRDATWTPRNLGGKPTAKALFSPSPKTPPPLFVASRLMSSDIRGDALTANLDHSPHEEEPQHVQCPTCPGQPLVGVEQRRVDVGGGVFERFISVGPFTDVESLPSGLQPFQCDDCRGSGLQFVEHREGLGWMTFVTIGQPTFGHNIASPIARNVGEPLFMTPPPKQTHQHQQVGQQGLVDDDGFGQGFDYEPDVPIVGVDIGEDSPLATTSAPNGLVQHETPVTPLFVGERGEQVAQRGADVQRAPQATPNMETTVLDTRDSTITLKLDIVGLVKPIRGQRRNPFRAFMVNSWNRMMDHHQAQRHRAPASKSTVQNYVFSLYSRFQLLAKPNSPARFPDLSHDKDDSPNHALVEQSLCQGLVLAWDDFIPTESWMDKLAGTQNSPERLRSFLHSLLVLFDFANSRVLQNADFCTVAVAQALPNFRSFVQRVRQLQIVGNRLALGNQKQRELRVQARTSDYFSASKAFLEVCDFKWKSLCKLMQLQRDSVNNLEHLAMLTCMALSGFGDAPGVRDNMVSEHQVFLGKVHDRPSVAQPDNAIHYDRTTDQIVVITMRGQKRSTLFERVVDPRAILLPACVKALVAHSDFVAGADLASYLPEVQRNGYWRALTDFWDSFVHTRIPPVLVKENDGDYMNANYARRTWASLGHILTLWGNSVLAVEDYVAMEAMALHTTTVASKEYNMLKGAKVFAPQRWKTHQDTLRAAETKIMTRRDKLLVDRDTIAQIHASAHRGTRKTFQALKAMFNVHDQRNVACPKCRNAHFERVLFPKHFAECCFGLRDGDLAKVAKEQERLARAEERKKRKKEKELKKEADKIGKKKKRRRLVRREWDD